MLSVIVVPSLSVDFSTRSELADCLNALARQAGAIEMEIIVPLDKRDRDVERQFPSARFLEAPDLGGWTGQELHDRLRARGVAAARGGIIAVIEDHTVPDGNWAASLMSAHRQPYAAIGGAIENGNDRPLHWAAYFADLGRYQNPVRAGESGFASIANVSYKREALYTIRSAWQERFDEPTVHGALLARGEKIALFPEIIVYHRRLPVPLKTYARDLFSWARSYAGIRSKSLPKSKALLYAAVCPALPFLMMFRLGSGVIRKRRNVGKFIAVSPYTAALTASWAAGEFAGYMRAVRG